MKRILLLSALAMVATVAQAQGPMAIAQKNAEAERKANMTGNFAWFDKTETKDYVEIGKNGKRTAKAASLAEMKAMYSQVKIENLTAKVLGAKFSGKDLVSTIDVHLLGSIAGVDGKKHSFDFTEKVEETWTKVGGEWKMRMQKTLSESGKIDGKAQIG